MNRSRAVIFAAVAILSSSRTALAACPMCKLAANEAGVGLAKGIFLSFLLVGSIPLVVFSVVGWHYLRLRRRTRRLEEQERP